MGRLSNVDLVLAMEGVAHIFRAYDIRGVFNVDLTADVMARIGMAMATYFSYEHVVGGDIRVSTPILKSALISGLLSAGVDVTDIGTVPLGAAMYASKRLNAAMAYVTASHLPPEWNGVKIGKPGGVMVTSEDVYNIGRLFGSPERLRKVPYDRVGKCRTYNVLPDYLSFLGEQLKSSGLNIVIDAGNGATTLVVPRLLRSAGHRVLCMHCDIDPTFSARGAEPEPEKLIDLRRAVKVYGADFGVAFDGDGDRVIFTDENGRVISPEQAAVVMLEGGERGDVVANVECSMILEEYVKGYGGKVFRVPVGHTFMVNAVSEKNAVLGVESSGHFVVRRNLNMDDGILALIHFADSLANIGEKVSKIVPPAYPVLRRKIRVAEDIKFKVVERLRGRLTAIYGEVETIDGVRVVADKGWVLIRPSNTEPLIRITVEGSSQEDAEKLLREFYNYVKSEIKAFESLRGRA
mgnify:CR=1 FL=1